LVSASKINRRKLPMKKLLYVTMLLAALGLIVSGCIEPSDDEKPEAITVLVQGSPIDGAAGIIFDSKDQLHISSIVGREIVVMDPETGEILDRLGPDVGVEGPDDLIFGPDGSLYWTSFLTGEVGRLSPDGVCTSQFVAPGVNPITFSDLTFRMSFLKHNTFRILSPSGSKYPITPQSCSPIPSQNPRQVESLLL
jgi:hypothetical protein